MKPDATIVFDYDGTVRLGWEHASHYARIVAAHLAPEEERAFLDAHAAYVAGRPITASTFDADDPDNAVRRLAAEYGIDDAVRRAAYEATRVRMADGDFAIWAPEGLREFLWGLPKSVEVVLATNAPAASLEPSLRRIGLEGLFDEVIGDARKPRGMGALLERLLGGRAASTLLSIGDIPRNDLAPAVELGCSTAYIDHFGRPWPQADASARTLPELFPFVRRWLGSR